MRIGRSGRTSDVFAEQLDKLAKKMPDTSRNVEEKLDEDRKDHGLEHHPGTEEAILAPDRKNDASTIGQQLIEKNLREHEGDKQAAAITEKLLNENKGNYPHRNPSAHERTGDKRPVNALDEEMGDAGDQSKLKRYEKSSKPDQDKRLLDKDVGSQMTNAPTKVRAFNLGSAKQAALEQKAAAYMAYRSGKFNHKFAEARKLDEAMTGIMAAASRENRLPSDEEKAQLEALKARKSEVLGLNA